MLEPVPHCHVVVTIPRLLRPLFRRRRELLRHLARCAADALGAYVQSRLGENVRPGIVVSVATAGDLGQWHPHLHILASDGGFFAEGTFHSLDQWDAEALMRLSREALLEGAKAEASEKRRCSPSWARLISKVYHADPLTCRECGGRHQVVAYIHDHFTIRKILDHLGLSPPEIERPPPDICYVPVGHAGRELESLVAAELPAP